jgi:hypothetical protein
MRPRGTHTAAAALIYWLMVMCGLAGLSMLRASTPREFVPLWVGSVAGVALGQLIGWMRLRVWLIAVMSICVLAASPIVLALLYATVGAFNLSLDASLIAFVPAAVCGYLSLSERAGLVAFWYPAMLWMVVILDRPGTGAFDAQKALPLVAGLGVLFVAFLRSRETRRTAIWSTYATKRLAEPISRTVLRASPLRAASQHLWSGLVGAGALVLAAWIAPHLWQKQVDEHPSRALASQSAERVAAMAADPSGEHCCTADDLAEERRERVKEYLPLKHGRETEGPLPPPRPPCTHCQSGKRPRVACGGAKGGDVAGTSTTAHGKDSRSTDNWAGDVTPGDYGTPGNGGGGYPNGGYASAGNGTPTYGNGGYGANAYVPEPPPPDPIPEVAPLPPVPPLPLPPKPAHGSAPAKVGSAPTAAPPPTDAYGSPPVAPVASTSPPSPAVVVLAPQPAAPPAGAPWRSALALCIGGFALHLALRAARRQLTLRHLARPFWKESLDQRVSNQWQRMLIGLRDAGIHPRSDEQPQALAKRVGIEGMSTCATILERVRHGLRVDAADLEAMDAAAAAVYRAARADAGAVARAAALVRSPL